jgi:integrase
VQRIAHLYIDLLINGKLMPRRVRNYDLETREARRKLKQRTLPYWTRLSEGLHLGYRRNAHGQGKWVVRHYLGKVRSTYRGQDSIKDYEKRTFAEADDYSDANGVSILTFDQAQARARELLNERVITKVGPYTVQRCIADYVAFLKTQGKDHKGAETRANALIVPELGRVEVAALTSAQLRQWLSDVAHSGARLRTASGQPQRFKPITDERARKTTANRILSIFKAALNHAYREERVASRDAWTRVKPFPGVSGVRLRYLSIAEAKRLINTSGGDLRTLVQCALQTGCRLSEILRLTVGDFNKDTGTVHVRQSKSGKERHVVLTDEGATFFDQLCAGRMGDERLLTLWNKSAVSRQMREAVARAHIFPSITFHGLRHTWASLAIMNGVPLQVIAQNLGHVDTRMVEHHYGHMARSHVVDAIRAGAPRFGIARSNVRRIDEAR